MAVVPVLKHLSSVYFNVMEKYIQKSFLTARKLRYRLLFEVEYHQESIIHSDSWRGYNGLVDLGYKKHYRIQHGTNDEFAKGKNHINGIESFWSFAKRRILKFHGIPTSIFYLHLKECEFRFNYRDKNIYAIFLKICKEKPLF
jgi:transposase-like protein